MSGARRCPAKKVTADLSSGGGREGDLGWVMSVLSVHVHGKLSRFYLEMYPGFSTLTSISDMGE